MNHELRLSEDAVVSRFRVAMPDVAKSADIDTSQEKRWYGNKVGTFASVAKSGVHSYRTCSITGLPVRDR